MRRDAKRNGPQIFTPEMRLRRNKINGANPCHIKLQTGPNTVDEIFSLGLSQMEWAAVTIAGQIAGEYAAGHRDVETDESYVEGVAKLANELAYATLKECHERQIAAEKQNNADPTDA